MILDNSYEFAKENRLTNLSFVEFQKRYARFDIMTSPAKDELLSVRHKAKCVCSRPSYWSQNEHERVRSKIENLALKSKGLHLGVERDRIQKYSNEQFTRAETLLKNGVQRNFNAPNIFLQPNDINQLILNTSLQPSFFQNPRGFETSTLKAIFNSSKLASPQEGVQHFRDTRALPAAAVGLVGKHAAPYLLSQSPVIMTALASKIKGVFMKKSKQGRPSTSNRNISEYLSQHFGKDLIFNQTKDRFIADLRIAGFLSNAVREQ